MSFHNTQDSLELWNFKGEKKGWLQQREKARSSHPSFTKHINKESLFLSDKILIFIWGL